MNPLQREASLSEYITVPLKVTADVFYEVIALVFNVAKVFFNGVFACCSDFSNREKLENFGNDLLSILKEKSFNVQSAVVLGGEKLMHLAKGQVDRNMVQKVKEKVNSVKNSANSVKNKIEKGLEEVGSLVDKVVESD